MKRDEKYMKLALAEAKKALELREVPIGAIIVCRDEIIARGYNQKERTNDPTAHAEIIAIKEAARKLQSWRLNNCELYVTLEPCPMCAGAILQARIDRLIFGATDPKAGATGTLYNLVQDYRFNHRLEVTPEILAVESQLLLKDFFQQLRSWKDG